jgi:hypothetical protein
MSLQVFVAYPGNPLELAQTMRATIGLLAKAWGNEAIHGWEENQIAGRFLTDPIFEHINTRGAVVADITFVNFNVTYEIGYAIGRGKRVILTRNMSLEDDEKLRQEIGIFDTLGYERYANHDELYDRLLTAIDGKSLSVTQTVNKASPLYFLKPPNQSGSLLHIFARVEKTKFRVRKFEPAEQPRLSAGDAIEQVASSAAVVVPLLPATHTGSRVHNIRAAFVIGLAHGLGVRCLAIQPADGPVPLDIRDVVKTYRSTEQIDEHVNEIIPAVVDVVYGTDAPILLPEGILSRTDLGDWMAENESGTLRRYFLQTDQYQQVLRGTVRLVLGRKGAGKTALFVQARERWRPGKGNVVVDLRPENYRLLKLRDAVLAFLAEGSREQMLTALWEYLLLLEVVSTILEEDYDLHLRDHNLSGPYQQLARQYKEGIYATGADFSERLVSLVDRLSERYEEKFGNNAGRQLSNTEVIELLYEHDTNSMRQELIKYLQHKDLVVILFDNLDKGWASQGLRQEDVIIVRALVTASDRVVKYLERAGVDAYVTIFLRNDIYEFLVDLTPDRGKHSRVSVDWRDVSQLKTLIGNRLSASKIHDSRDFIVLWHMICVSHYKGEPSFDHMADRCVMRPRYLLRIIKACRTAAINRQHSRIEEDDIERGVEEFSNELVLETDLEIRDVIPEAGEVMFRFLGESRDMRRETLLSFFPPSCQSDDLRERLLDLLLWSGVFGLHEINGQTTYIYSLTVGYSLKKLKALVTKSTNALFRINPAFEQGLQVQEVALHGRNP